MFDTHSHLNFNNYKTDSKEIIARCLERNIKLIVVGSQFDTSARAAKIALDYEDGVYASIGLHPIHLVETDIDEGEFAFKSRAERFDEGKYKNLLNKKIVAVGETGLDYFHIPPEIDFEELKYIQTENFIKQMEFADGANLPLILHCRGAKDQPFEAYHEMIDIIKKVSFNNRKEKKGVIHCFAGNWDIAEKFLEAGFYIGFTGIITFKNISSELLEVIKKMPMDKILGETDCPYLAPQPHRGERCIPQYVEFTLHKIAQLRDMDYEKVIAQTDKNAQELFNIKTMEH